MMFFTNKVQDIAKNNHITVKKIGVTTLQFTVTPKTNTQDFKQLMMKFRRNKLVELIIFDHLQQKTQIKFTQVNLNPEFKSNLFTFSPPKGVEVVEQ